MGSVPTRWVRVCAVGDCPPGEARELVADDRLVALYNVDGAFHALDGVCPHQGGPLGKGALRGKTVTCPWHGWQFDVVNGRHCFAPGIVQPTLPVEVRTGDVWIGLE